MTQQEAARIVDLSKLPDDASEMLRIVRIGDYDACACMRAAREQYVGNRNIQNYQFGL